MDFNISTFVSCCLVKTHYLDFLEVCHQTTKWSIDQYGQIFMTQNTFNRNRIEFSYHHSNKFHKIFFSINFYHIMIYEFIISTGATPGAVDKSLQNYFEPIVFLLWYHTIYYWLDFSRTLKYTPIDKEWYFFYQNCSDLLWEKNVLVIDKNFCKTFEITRTIYSNSKRSEQFLVKS